MKTTRKLLTLTVCLCLIFVITGFLPVRGEEKIYDSVIRLHVIANSDSEEDQAIKLCVRDAILQKNLFLDRECETIEQAKETVSQKLAEIKQCAEQEICRLGYTYSVEVRLCKEDYPTKSYGSLCFPSGRYLSLQVLIGDAEGENWWCVLFPPLCLTAATNSQTNEDAFISVGLSSEQYNIITQTKEPTYEVRFKILEAIEKALK